MLIDLLIAVGDKLLPEAIKQFIPLINVKPVGLKFIKSEWTTESNFFIYSRSKNALFDIYLLIKLGNAKTEDFDLSKTNSPKNLRILIKNIEINYEILRLNLINKDNKEFIILKIAQIDPESFTPFRIMANINSNIKFKILKYSKKQPAILHQPQAGAISFEIPLKKEGGLKLKGLEILMKRGY